jgi:hypothetical protein
MSRWHTSRGPWGSGPDETGPACGFARRGYHHGNLKEALIEAARLLTAERGPHGRGVREGLAAMGRAYLAFAREQPGYYGAMFGWRDPTPTDGGTDGPFASLVSAIARVLPQGADPHHARLLAIEVWALAHGLAGLEQAGMPPPGSGAPSHEAVLEDAVERLLRIG